MSNANKSVGVEDLVSSLYRAILGRDPDPAGLSYYADRISQGSSFTAIIREFLTSPERRHNLACRYFPAGSGHLPGPDGMGSAPASPTEKHSIPSKISGMREEVHAVFEAIYREDRWTNGSGPGALPEKTIEYRAFLAQFLEANGITSVTDLGCGDWQSSRFIDWSQINYLGVDVVPELIERNIQRYAVPGLDFRVLRSADDLPGGDLLIAKHVLQHLPNEIVADYLAVIRQRYRCALLTDAIEPQEQANTNIEIGGCRPLRFDRAPFNCRGALIFTYLTQYESHCWRSGVFLLPGEGPPPDRALSMP